VPCASPRRSRESWCVSVLKEARQNNPCFTSCPMPTLLAPPLQAISKATEHGCEQWTLHAQDKSCCRVAGREVKMAEISLRRITALQPMHRLQQVGTKSAVSRYMLGTRKAKLTARKQEMPSYLLALIGASTSMPPKWSKLSSCIFKQSDSSKVKPYRCTKNASTLHQWYLPLNKRRRSQVMVCSVYY